MERPNLLRPGVLQPTDTRDTVLLPHGSCRLDGQDSPPAADLDAPFFGVHVRPTVRLALMP